MKINLNQIPQEGLQLKETCPPEQLNLDSNDIKFKQPLEIQADVDKGINTVTVSTDLKTEAESVCSIPEGNTSLP